jgi:hypothetical protein
MATADGPPWPDRFGGGEAAMDLTHTLVDVIGASFVALFEFLAWTCVTGWAFIGLSALFLINILRGRPLSGRSVTAVIVLVFLGAALIWLSAGNAFKVPVKGFSQVMGYVRAG